MRRLDPRAGFTLIEVLVSLAITLALVSVALPFATRLATRWWVGERPVEVADSWMRGIALLGDDVSEAVAVSIGGGPKAVSAFAGGPNFVQFVRPALGASAATDLQRVRYEIRPSAVGTRLVRRAARFSTDTFMEPMTGDPEGTTILEGPARLLFSIQGRDAAPRTNWTPERQMPTGIAVSVRAAHKDWLPQSLIMLPVVARTFVASPKPRDRPASAGGSVPASGTLP